MTLGAILEAISLGAVPAFVSVIMKPSSLCGCPWIGEWPPALADSPTVNIVAWSSVAFFILIIVKNGLLVLVYAVQARIIATQRMKLGNRMFRAYQSAPYEWHLARNSLQLIRNIQIDTTQVLNSVLVPFLGLGMVTIMTTFIILMLLLSAPGAVLAGLAATCTGLYLVIQSLHRPMLAGVTPSIRRKTCRNTLFEARSDLISFLNPGLCRCDQQINPLRPISPVS